MIVVLELRTPTFAHMPEPHKIWGPFNSPEVAHAWATERFMHFDVYTVSPPPGLPTIFTDPHDY
jgi:hypothetical protein